MILHKIIDPRDALDKASRDEIYAFAKKRGVTEIDEKMFMGPHAATIMRKILRQKGITDISIPFHILGLPKATAESVAAPSGEPAMMAEDLAMKEYMETQNPKSSADVPVIANTKSRNAEIVRERSAGISAKELAAKHGISTVRVHQIIHKAKVRG